MSCAVLQAERSPTKAVAAPLGLEPPNHGSPESITESTLNELCAKLDCLKIRMRNVAHQHAHNITTLSPPKASATPTSPWPSNVPYQTARARSDRGGKERGDRRVRDPRKCDPHVVRRVGHAQLFGYKHRVRRDLLEKTVDCRRHHFLA